MLEVINRDGTKHDLAWLQANYGSGLVYHQAPDGMYPRFELRQVFITEGSTVLRFTVICADGTACVGQPVAYSFPTIGSPSSDLPAVPAGADKAHWITRACIERCDPRGGHEFQIGKDSWTKGLAAASSGATALQKAFAADPNFGFYTLKRTPGMAASGVVGRGPYAV